ncbi:MAG: hypothetical protein KVP17_004148 [Porospora cf. gigantea B]|uniref:uncharacterized protein n=1 Tax=Porospora cf. gigantea B TaxID=2853592 RepID=UPI0035717BF9|nr:MAG: hypothetical protein KVP17_004148 [Porospora cf. gigantea B]
MPGQELSPYSPRRVVQKLRYRREEDASSRPKQSDSHTPSTLKKLFSRSWRVDTSAQVEEVEDLKTTRQHRRETREVRRLERKLGTKVDKDNQDPLRAHKYAKAEAEMATPGKSRPRVNTVGGTTAGSSKKTKVVASSAIHHLKPKAGTAAADIRMHESRRRLLVTSVSPVEPRPRQDPPGPTRRVAPAPMNSRRPPRVNAEAVSLKPDERTLPVTKPRVLSNLNFVPTQSHLEHYKAPTSTPRPRERKHHSEVDSPTTKETYKTPTSTPRPRERKHHSEVDSPTTKETCKTPTSTPRPRERKHHSEVDSPTTKETYKTQTLSVDPLVRRPEGTSLPSPRTERSDSSVPMPRPPQILHRKLPTTTYFANKEPAHTRRGVPPRNLTPKQEPYESTLNPFVLSSSQAQVVGAKTVDKSPSRTRADAVYNWKMARHYIDSLRTDLDQMHVNGVPFRDWKTEPVETLGQSAGRPQKMHKATVPSNGVHGPVGVFLKRVPYRIWYNQWRSMIDWQGDYVTDGENYVMEAAVMAFLTNNNIPLGPKLIAVATVHGSSNQPSEMVLVSELYGQDLLEHLARQGRRRLSEAQRFRLQYKVTQLQAK